VKNDSINDAKSSRSSSHKNSTAPIQQARYVVSASRDSLQPSEGSQKHSNLQKQADPLSKHSSPKQDIASKEQQSVRKKKLLAIGTMLEQSLIKDPHRGINQDMPLPRVFINTKIYGYNTDDPNSDHNLFAMHLKSVKPDQEHFEFKHK
jgi:hypothetical protein